MAYFVSQFMKIYSFKNNQHGKRRCKNCRYFKRRLSEYEVGALKQFAECLPEEYKKVNEFSICKVATNMALKAIENEHERGPIIVPQNGYCTLFKMSILKAIKNIFRKEGEQA